MLELNFNPFPDLETTRLELRRITINDIVDLFNLRSNNEVMLYIKRSVPITIDEIAILIQKMEDMINSNNGIVWGITLKGESRIIGSIGLHRIEKENFRAEVGYMLLPEFWHKGIMSEAIQVLLRFGFETINLHSIQANIDPRNTRSKNVLLKFNFEKEAYFKESFYSNGKFLDTEIYSLLKSKSIK